MINGLLDHLKQETFAVEDAYRHRQITPYISSSSFVFLVYQKLQLVKYKDTSSEVVLFCKSVPDHESTQRAEKSLGRFETSELSFLIDIFNSRKMKYLISSILGDTPEMFLRFVRAAVVSKLKKILFDIGK